MLPKKLSKVTMAGFLSLLVAGCASSDLVDVVPVAGGQAGSIGVARVEVVIDTPRPNPKLKQPLSSELKQQLSACATGTTPHVVRVTINQFEDQNVAKSLLIGDEIELGGKVQFINANTGSVTGEYYVKESFFWGGIAGAALMANAEKSLSKDFAKSVCEKVLKG